MLIFTEGFDAYGTTPTATNLDTYISRKWPTFFDPGPAFGLATGRLSGRAFSVHQNRWIQSPNLGNNVDTLVGFAINPQNMTDANARLVSFYEGTNEGINVRLLSTGELAVYKGGTLLATSSGAGISLGNWSTIEIHVHAHASTGTYELHLNGVSVLSGSGIDTRASSNAYYDFVRVGPTGSSFSYCNYDDLYMRDDSTFLNSFKIQTIFPNGDDTVACVPSTGVDNYALVDEGEPNGDTDYVTGDPADSDLYDYQSVADISSVYAIAVNTVCRQTDATPLDVKLLAKSGGTTDASAAQSVGSTSFVQRSAIWEDNPDTSSPWTASEVNAASFGFEIE